MNSLVKDVMTTQVIWVERDTPFAAYATWRAPVGLQVIKADPLTYFRSVPQAEPKPWLNEADRPGETSPRSG
jgi:hypothetical protein